MLDDDGPVLTPDLTATLERAHLVVRRRDGAEHSRIDVPGIDAVEHLALQHLRASPPRRRWSLGELDAVLERAGWQRLGVWRINAARRTTARMIPTYLDDSVAAGDQARPLHTREAHHDN